MRYLAFRRAMHDFPVFSLRDARALDPRFDRRRLSEWQQRGLIRKLSRGHYLFTDVDVDEQLLFAAARKLHAPSYVSFETALAYYGLIPETVHVVVSASTRKTMRFDTPIGRFAYHAIAPKRFFGYRPVPGHGAIAEIEKALIDYFYIHTEIASEDDFNSLRINAEMLLETMSRDRLEALLQRMGHRHLAERMNAFMDWLAHA